MNIEYKMTEYFKDNNLLNEKTTNGLTVQKDNETIIIKGDTQDLVELADILISLAKDNDNGAHIHLDEKTLLDDNSQYKNVIIEKI